MIIKAMTMLEMVIMKLSKKTTIMMSAMMIVWAVGLS